MRHMRDMKATALDEYAKERASLCSSDIDHILERGRDWDISSTLAKGGSALFPHTYMHACGHQIAAVVHGCLNSGTDQVVVLGVLHPLNQRLMRSRVLEIESRDISRESCWGILGPGIQRDEAWKEEFSLLNFLFLWEHEIRRRGIVAPKLIIRYPCLANRAPAAMPGMRELQHIVADSIVVATADLCHHGIAYGNSRSDALSISQEGLQFAHRQIEGGLQLLAQDDYDAYYQYCLETKSDSLDIGTVLRYLLGPLRGTILDLHLIDASELYEGAPQPSWVAASLVELTPAVILEEILQPASPKLLHSGHEQQ